MRCKPHCPRCTHMCINSPMFKKLSIEDRIYIILNDEEIVEDEENNSGVYQQTPEVMLEFARIGDSIY